MSTKSSLKTLLKSTNALAFAALALTATSAQAADEEFSSKAPVGTVVTVTAGDTDTTLTGTVAGTDPSSFTANDASKAQGDVLPTELKFANTQAAEKVFTLGGTEAGKFLYLKDVTLSRTTDSTQPVTAKLATGSRLDTSALTLDNNFKLELDGYLKLNTGATVAGLEQSFSVKDSSATATLETDSAAGGTSVLKTLEGVSDKHVDLLNLVLTKNDFVLTDLDATKFKKVTLTGDSATGTWEKFKKNVEVAQGATLKLTGFDSATVTDANVSDNQNLGKLVLEGDLKLDAFFDSANAATNVGKFKSAFAGSTNPNANDAVTFAAESTATTEKDFAGVKAGVEALLANTGAKAVSLAPVALTVNTVDFTATDAGTLDKFKSVTFAKDAKAKDFTVLNKDTKVTTKLTFTDKAAPGSLATFLEKGTGKNNGTLLTVAPATGAQATPAKLVVLDDQAFTKDDLAAVTPDNFGVTVEIETEGGDGKSPVTNKKQLWLIASEGLADVADNLKVSGETKKAVVFNGSADAAVATPLADGTKFDDWLITSASENPAQVETNAKPGHGVIFNPSQDPNPTHAADKPSTLTVALDGKTALTDFLPESFAKLGTVENFKTKFVAKTDGKELSYTKEDADKFTAAVDKFAVVNKAATTDAPVETALVFKDTSASAADVPNTSAFLGKVEAGTTKVLESVGAGTDDQPKTYVLGGAIANSDSFDEFRISAETFGAAATSAEETPTPVSNNNLLAKNVVTATGKLWLGGFTGFSANTKTLTVQKDGTLALKSDDVSLDTLADGVTLAEGAKVSVEGGTLKTNKESLAAAVDAAKAKLSVAEGKVALESTKHLNLGTDAQFFNKLTLKAVTPVEGDKLERTSLTFADATKVRQLEVEAGRGPVDVTLGAPVEGDDAKATDFALGAVVFNAVKEDNKATEVNLLASKLNNVVVGADTELKGNAGYNLKGEGTFTLTGTNTHTATALNVVESTLKVDAGAKFATTDVVVADKGTLDLTASTAESTVQNLTLAGGVTKFAVAKDKTHSALTATKVTVDTTKAPSFDLSFADVNLDTDANTVLNPEFLKSAVTVLKADGEKAEEAALLKALKVTDDNLLYDYTVEKTENGLTFKSGERQTLASSLDEKAETLDEAKAVDELVKLERQSTDPKATPKALATALSSHITAEQRDLLLQEVKPLLQGSLGGVVAENTASLAGHLPQVDVLAFGSQLAPLAFQSYVQNYLAARNGKLSVRDLKGLEFADNGGLASAAKGAKAQQGTGVNAWVSAVFDSSSQGVKKEESASAQAQPAQGAQAQPAQQAATTAAKYGYDASSQSVFVGADKLVLPGDEYVVAEGYRVGLVAGYTRNAVKTSTDSTVKNEARVNLFQVGAYANLAVAPGVVVDALAGYGYANVNGKRVLSTLNAVSDSNYGAQVVFGSVGVNYSLPVGPGLLTPYAKVSYTGTFSPEYAETEGDLNTLFQSSFTGVTPVKGANDSLLKVAAETNQALVLEAGSKYEVAVSPELRAYATLGVAYDVLAAAAANTSATFAAQGATAKLEGTTYALDPFRVKAGVGATYQVLENVDLSFGYNFTGLNNFQSHEGNLKLNVKF